MTRLPTPLHRSYARANREFGPWSIPGLVERWPISGGRQFTDSAGTTHAGAADPVGNWDGALGIADFVQATTAKKPTLDATGPGVRFDMVDDLLQANYALSLGSRWAMAMAVWGRDDSDKIVLDSLSGVANLSGEFGMRIGAGANRQVTVPANLGAGSSWAAGVFAIAHHASTSGIERYLGTIWIDANNLIRLYQGAADTNLVRADIIASGAAVKTVTRSLTWSAGAILYVGARLHGGTLYLSAANITTGGTTLTESSVGSVGAFTGSSWTFKIGGSNADADHNWEGAINCVLTNDGSSVAPITDRFNAGLGMAIEEWCNRHSDKLVLYGPHSTDGGATHSWKTAYGSVPAVTRNDTANQVNWLGVVEPVAVNILRNRHRLTTNESGGPSRRVTLLERAYTNKVTAALADWTPANCVITSVAEADPGGGTTAALLTADAGSADHRIAFDSASAIGPLSGEVWLKAGTHPYARLLHYNGTDGYINRMALNISTGAVLWASGMAGYNSRITVRGDGWVRVQLFGPSPTAANSSVFVSFTDSAGDAAYNAAGTETIYVWRPTLYQEKVPPESVLAASEATTADSLTVPLTLTTPQEATYLYEGVVCDLPNMGRWLYLFDFGHNNGNADAMLAYYHQTEGRLMVYMAPSSEGYWNVALALRDRIAIRFHRAANGVVDAVGLSINGGPEDTTLDGAFGSTIPLPGAWHANEVFFGDPSYPTNHGLSSFKAQSGAEKSLATMQALINPDICVYRAGQTSELATVSYSVSTSGVPSRVIWSASKDGALQPYVYAALATDEKLEIGVRNDAATRTEASSSGSVTTGVHSMIFEWDGTNLKAYLDTVLVATLTPGAGTYTGLDRLNLGGLVGYIEGHPFDERIADPWLHAGAAFPGYTAIDRVRLHNYLAARVTGLSAV